LDPSSYNKIIEGNEEIYAEYREAYLEGLHMYEK